MGWHPVAKQAVDRFHDAVRHGTKFVRRHGANIAKGLVAAAAVGAAAYAPGDLRLANVIRDQTHTRGLARRDGPRLMEEYRRHRATVPEDDGNDDWGGYPRR